MSRTFPGKSGLRGWTGGMKLAVCLLIPAALAGAWWLRWIPGRPLSPQWARGGASPDNSLSYEEEDDITPKPAEEDVLSAPDFLFMMGQGNGVNGYDVLRVWPDGRCEYSFPDLARAASARAAGTPTSRPATSAPSRLVVDLAPWRRAKFTVDAGTVSDLRQALAGSGFLSLKHGYHADNADGMQWLVNVRAAGKEKAVVCDNHFPIALIRLNDFIRDRIVEPNHAAIAMAGAVDLPRNWLPALGVLPTRQAEPGGKSEE